MKSQQTVIIQDFSLFVCMDVIIIFNHKITIAQPQTTDFMAKINSPKKKNLQQTVLNKEIWAVIFMLSNIAQIQMKMYHSNPHFVKFTLSIIFFRLTIPSIPKSISAFSIGRSFMTPTI